MKRKIGIIISICLMILCNFYIVKYVDKGALDLVELKVTVQSDKDQVYQMYYQYLDDKEWSETNSVVASYKAGKEETLAFKVPCNIKRLRFDVGNVPANHKVKNLFFSYKNKTWDLDLSLLEKSTESSWITEMVKSKDGLHLTTNSDDPHIEIDLAGFDIINEVVTLHESDILKKNILICALLDFMVIFVLVFYRQLMSLPLEIIRNKKLVFDLAKNDFKTRYAGSYLGIIWAFIQPIVTVVVYWFVFQVGFRSGDVGDCPYILWFISGLIPWFFFAEALATGTNSMVEYSYLVKKVVFNISVLPVVKLVSALFVHIFFVCFMLLIFILMGFGLDISAIQVVYYSFCMFVLVLGISYATCALNIFFRDLNQIISIVLQVGMWMTPIMWQYTMVPAQYRWILKLNPMFYVVDGYRNALIYKVPFWSNLNMFLYFWIITGLLFGIGAFIFKRLRPHFADVL